MEKIILSKTTSTEEVLIYKGCKITAYDKATNIFGNDIREINAKVFINEKEISLVECNDGGKFNSLEHARNQAISFIDSLIK